MIKPKVYIGKIPISKIQNFKLSSLILNFVGGGNLKPWNKVWKWVIVVGIGILLFFLLSFSNGYKEENSIQIDFSSICDSVSKGTEYHFQDDQIKIDVDSDGIGECKFN